MAYIRNMLPRMVAFDLPALGTHTHHGATLDLDPGTGIKGLRPHVKVLPKSITLAACVDPRKSLADAILDGSAVDDLPDEAVDAEEIRARLARRELHAEKTEPAPTPDPNPLHSTDDPTHDEVTP